MNKTYKALSKRMKKTKNGKVVKRAVGQDHFNTRESGKVTRNKRSDVAGTSFVKLVNENIT